jgi:hypothetical protein
MLINKTLSDIKNQVFSKNLVSQKVPFVPVLSIIGLCLLIFAPVASGSVNVVDRFNIDRNLDVEIISGYPYDYNSLDDLMTLGFIFRNRGTQRQLRLELSGDINTTREISVPAGETRRLFVYMPHFTNWQPLAITAFADKWGLFFIR